jgi:hypothetical protein
MNPTTKHPGRPKKLTSAQRRSVTISLKVRPAHAATMRQALLDVRDRIEREFP